MGLLGKSFASKFKTITTLAVSRIAILKNHRKARTSYARSDVAQLLNLGYHHQALLRVEQWIAEQNMLDVFVMIENYCNFLRERAQVLENNKECPIEMKEATCSLIFASSRCGEFPELHKIQEIFTSKFGKEFADHAVVGLHNNVNSKMIQKLSSRRPTMEIKMKALKQIATEIGVTLHFEEDPNPMLINMDKLSVDQRQQEEVETRKLTSVDDDVPRHKENNNQLHDPENIIKDNEYVSDGNEERRRNKYAAAAALEALELASFMISKYTNHKDYVHPMVSSSCKQKDEVISKSNHSKELEGKEIQKQFAWEEEEEEESHSSHNPRDGDMSTPKLVSMENTKRESNILGELGSAKSLDNNNDHKSQCDAAIENEHLREERAQPSSSSSFQAIRWNPQRSQTDPAVNHHIVRRAVMTHHGQIDWKMMSVRTR